MMLNLVVPLLLTLGGAPDVDVVPSRAPFPETETKKGLQVQMVDDALALGVRHAALNVDLTRLIDPRNETEGPTWQRDGKTFTFSKPIVAQLDQRVKSLSEAKVVVYLILLPYASGDRRRDALLLHPNYARGKKHAGPIGMFNTTTPEAAAWLAATVEFLAARYRGGEQGEAWGFIAGNEVNSHWFWANMGEATQQEVIAEYERAVRIIQRAVRSASEHARVYISLEHCWAERYAGGNDRQCLPGRDFLAAFARQVREHGDFDWHLAYHPYPEPLTECRFWLDRKNSPQRDDAPCVTFRNLEVLMRRLEQGDLTWQDKPRRVILSEQGFHCSDRPEAEKEQAAAYALAYKKVEQLSGIDAFILHRHVDHAKEGGLRLGLWTNKPSSIATPDRKRLMYDVFEAAGTPREAQIFDSLLPVLGFSTWNAALEDLKQ